MRFVRFANTVCAGRAPFTEGAANESGNLDERPIVPESHPVKARPMISAMDAGARRSRLSEYVAGGQPSMPAAAPQ